MRLKDRELKMFATSSKLIFKAPMSNNKTFKIMINILDHNVLHQPLMKTKIGVGIKDMGTSILEVSA